MVVLYVEGFVSQVIALSFRCDGVYEREKVLTLKCVKLSGGHGQ